MEYWKSETYYLWDNKVLKQLVLWSFSDGCTMIAQVQRLDSKIGIASRHRLFF